jgi:hypothetical protein
LNVLSRSDIFSICMLLTTSGFKNKDSIKQLIELNASVMSWAFSPDLTCQVTHVLVPASSDEAMEARTDKLQAILADRSLWPQHVVSARWLEECVNEGTVVPVGPFLVTLIPPCSDQKPQAEAGSSSGRSEDWGSMIRDLIKTGKIGVDPEVALTEQDRQGLKQVGAEVAELTQGTFGIDLIICDSDRAVYWIKEWGFLGHILSLSAVRRLNGNASPPKVSVISTDCLRSMQQNMSVTQDPLPSQLQPNVACADDADRREVLRSIKSSESNILVRPPAPLTLLSQLRWTVGSSPQSPEAADASQSEVVESDARVLYSCGITAVVPLDEGGFLGLHPLEIKSPSIAPYLTCGDITSAVNAFYEQKIEDEEVVRLMRRHPGIRKLLQSKYLNRIGSVQRLDLLGSRISFAGMERLRGGGAVGGEIYEIMLVK